METQRRRGRPRKIDQQAIRNSYSMPNLDVAGFMGYEFDEEYNHTGFSHGNFRYSGEKCYDHGAPFPTTALVPTWENMDLFSFDDLCDVVSSFGSGDKIRTLSTRESTFSTHISSIRDTGLAERRCHSETDLLLEVFTDGVDYGDFNFLRTPKKQKMEIDADGSSVCLIEEGLHPL